jgi:hypothetical protein
MDVSGQQEPELLLEESGQQEPELLQDVTTL